MKKLDEMIEAKEKNSRILNYALEAAGITIFGTGLYPIITKPKTNYLIVDSVLIGIGISYFSLSLFSRMLKNKDEKKRYKS